MPNTIKLSICTIPDDVPVARDAPRPLSLRNENYEGQYDWKTLFYDVYASGKYVVFQGPPLFNLKERLTRYPYFASKLGALNFQNRIYDRKLANDIWIKSDDKKISLRGDLGSFDIDVQPDGNGLFAGKRVLLTLSKNNEIHWIIDWITYYVNSQGTDAVLFYDNNSDKYSPGELQDALSSAFPGLLILVISWPFKYGPQGGVSGGVGGKIAPWDSVFCQIGVLQHARFRFLQKARSVLNCDIDELIVSKSPQSVYERAEASIFGVTHFGGVWISNASAAEITGGVRRHAHYYYFEKEDTSKCANKWCAVPRKCSAALNTWTVHSIANQPSKFLPAKEYVYRHFKPISDNWKYGRYKESDFSPEDFVEDIELRQAMEKYIPSRKREEAA
ncbi:MAG: glycosyltransferase family 92 protein [Alphaproteobacteria bacterium]